MKRGWIGLRTIFILDLIIHDTSIFILEQKQKEGYGILT